MTNEETTRKFMQQIWNEKDLTNIELFIAATYTIHCDNGDPWEGKIFDQAEFIKRLHNSFDPFPDIHFEITASIADGDAVAITWIMTGTNTGDIGGYPPTNQKIKTTGITIYHFNEGKISGHTQVYDRTTIMEQLGFI